MQNELKKESKWLNTITPYFKSIGIFLLAGFTSLLCFYALFFNLGFLPIRLWDESRLAVSALEMYQHHNWLIPTFEHQPDVWSTKPPLMIWLQVLSLHLFGINEWAIRFPSALAGLLTVFVIVYFLKKYFSNLIAGLISGCVLITSYGYVNEHVTRTGDYDALLSFWGICMLLSLWIWSKKPNSKMLIVFTLSVFLSIFTKGVQGLMLLPFAVVFLFVASNQRFRFFKLISFSVLTSIAAALFYYLIRENLNPGYLEAVWNNELGGRYLSSIELHNAPFEFYFNLLYHHHFRYWFWPFIISLGSFFICDNRILKEFIIYLFICSMGYLLIISMAQTKLEWYAAPVYPLLAIQLGIGMQVYLSRIYNLIKPKAIASAFVSFSFIVLLAEPVKTVYYRFKAPEFYSWEVAQYNLSFYLQGLIRNNSTPHASTLVLNRYPAEILFYTYQLKTKTGFNLIKSHEIEPPLTALVIEEDVKHQLSNQYNCSVDSVFKDISIFRIEKLPDN